MKEIWRSVVGYEGLYEVSNWGRVKSLARVDSRGNRIPERILKPQKDKDGYLLVALCKDGKQKIFKLHRLVAQTFLENPQNLPQVNHRDEVKTNNFVFVREDGSVDFSKSNLEWMTAKKNSNYGSRNERIAKTKSKTVYQYTLSGEFVKEWVSANEVQRQTGWSQGHISECCRGELKSAYGFCWSYSTVAPS